MILDINLPHKGCFVGLVQRFVVFASNYIGFTLYFEKLAAECEIVLKPLATRLSQAKVLLVAQSMQWCDPTTQAGNPIQQPSPTTNLHREQSNDRHHTSPASHRS